MNNYDRFSDNELKSKVALHLEFARSYDEQADHAREWAAEYQDELYRRDIVRAWENLPGLRLQAGDKLIITPRAWQWLTEHGGSYEIGDETSIAEVGLFADGRLFITGKPRWAYPIELAREMRQAYLDREAANEGMK